MTETSPEWQARLVADLRSAGASLVGFADLTDLPVAVRSGLPRAVSIGIALAPDIVRALTAGPTRDYYAEYGRVNALLARLTEEASRTIEARGFSARTSAITVRVVHGDGATALPHKTVATRAGLGWIGDCALLITPEFGAAVRLASVLTDAPLACGAATNVSRCGTCVACVEACPAHAVTGTPWHAGIPREQIFDAGACRAMASSLAAAQEIDETICGICIHACPWTQRYLRLTGAACQ